MGQRRDEDAAAIALAVLLGTHLLRSGVAVWFRDSDPDVLRLAGYAPLFLSAALLFALGRHRYPAALGPAPRWRAALHGVLWYALFFPLVLGVHWVNERFATGSAPRQETIHYLAQAPEWSRMLVMLLVVSIVPLSEELLFRGFLQRGTEALLLQRLRAAGAARWGAIVISAAVFAGVHERFAMLPVFVVGVIAGRIAAGRAGLTGSCCFHALHNAVTLWTHLQGESA